MDDVSLKVFVGSIDFNATEQDLEDAFRPYGEIVHVILLRDKETQKSRGFGFITFKERHSVEAAIKGMNKQLIRGRPIVVNYAEKKSNSNSGGGGGGGAGSSINPAGDQSNFAMQQNFGYPYGQQQQNAFYQGQQGFGAWNQQGYGWGYWPQQAYGNWGQAWNQMQQQQYNQQGPQQQYNQQQGPQQPQQQGGMQGLQKNQSFNDSSYSNSSQSGF